MADLLPNTFLIGAQKAATTSLYYWLSQHPEICAPMSVKDYAFFTRPEYYNQGIAHINSYYNKDYQNQKIVLQGSVHYIFFENALKRIHKHQPEAKFILALRHPVDRAVSAYKYAKKFNYESEGFENAIKLEKKRLQCSDMRKQSECTYLHHGLYFEQTSTFLKYFDKEQLHVCFYEDIKSTPKDVIKNLFDFLEIDSNFIPELKTMNTTGKVKNKTFQKIAFGEHPIRNFIVRKILRKIIPEKTRTNLRWKVIDMNTSSSQTQPKENLTEQKTLEHLNDFFKEDIIKLEQLLDKDLSHWKQNDRIIK